ncbi:hypothetical protein CEXT_271211 [Caerostris extrusa]|uniref:Uncharacterized protein n=1 Tax=Caerostris extrusa TaxID=172846 RepID=A0AAV4TFB6_CAEEX|nr:hypothetical protein CEXT_271211 [Caerostris extrusa]
MIYEMASNSEGTTFAFATHRIRFIQSSLLVFEYNTIRLQFNGRRPISDLCKWFGPWIKIQNPLLIIWSALGRLTTDYFKMISNNYQFYR